MLSKKSFSVLQIAQVVVGPVPTAAATSPAVSVARR